jgi:hypothetical protein
MVYCMYLSHYQRTGKSRRDLRVAIQKRVVIRAATFYGKINTNPNPIYGHHWVESCVIGDRGTLSGWYRLARRRR